MAAKAQRRRTSHEAPVAVPPPRRAPLDEPPAEVSEVTRLINRVAVLTFVTAFAFVVGLIALPKVFDGGAGALGRVLAGAPLVASIGLLAWVRRLRARLREAREGASPTGGAARPEGPPAGR